MGCGVALTYIENRKQINLQSLPVKDTKEPAQQYIKVEKLTPQSKQNAEPKIIVVNTETKKKQTEKVTQPAPTKVSPAQKIQSGKGNGEVQNRKTEQKQATKIASNLTQSKKQQPQAAVTQPLKEKQTIKKEEKPKQANKNDSKLANKEQKPKQTPKPPEVKQVKKQELEKTKIKSQPKQVPKVEDKVKIEPKKEETKVQKIQAPKQLSKQVPKATQVKAAPKKAEETKNVKNQGQTVVKKAQSDIKAQKKKQSEVTQSKKAQTKQTKQTKPVKQGPISNTNETTKAKANSQNQKQKKPQVQKDALKNNQKQPVVEKTEKPKSQQGGSKATKAPTSATQHNKQEKKAPKNMIPVEAVFFDENILKSTQSKLNPGQSDLSKTNPTTNVRPQSKQQVKNGGEGKNKNVIKLKQNVPQVVPEQKLTQNKDKTKVEKPSKEQQKQPAKKKEQDKAAQLHQEKKVEQAKKKLLEEEKKKKAQNSTQLKQIYVVS